MSKANEKYENFIAMTEFNIDILVSQSKNKQP